MLTLSSKAKSGIPQPKSSQVNNARKSSIDKKSSDSLKSTKKEDHSLASNSVNYSSPSTSYQGAQKPNLKYHPPTPIYRPPLIQPPKYNGLKMHDKNGWVAASSNSSCSNKRKMSGSDLYKKLFTLESKILHKMESFRENFVDHIRTENTIVREFMAEFIGTFFLLLIGMSANVQQASSPDGSIVSAQLAWGFGFAFAVYLAASVSGAHLNPAISFAALFSGDLSPPRFILYVFAQLLGAFSGTAIAYLGHLDDIKRLESLNGVVNETWTTAGLFATYPSEHITEIGSLFDQIIGTAILAGCLCLITDKKHRIPSGVVPMLAGIVMSMVAMTFGANGGFAINPARDFSPRLFLLCVGYGWSVFSANDYYFWIPIVGPIIGALLGTWIYKMFVGIHGLNENIEITGGKPYPRDDRGVFIEYIGGNGQLGIFQQPASLNGSHLSDSEMKSQFQNLSYSPNYSTHYTTSSTLSLDKKPPVDEQLHLDTNSLDNNGSRKQNIFIPRSKLITLNNHFPVINDNIRNITSIRI